MRFCEANELGSAPAKSDKGDLCRTSKQSTIFGKRCGILFDMNQATKRIVLAFRLANEPGRRKLDGFLRYIAENRLDWQLQFVRIREAMGICVLAYYKAAKLYYVIKDIAMWGNCLFYLRLTHSAKKGLSIRYPPSA